MSSYSSDFLCHIYATTWCLQERNYWKCGERKKSHLCTTEAPSAETCPTLAALWEEAGTDGSAYKPSDLRMLFTCRFLATVSVVLLTMTAAFL